MLPASIMTAITTLTDADLLAAVQGGEEQAFDLFVDRYGRRLFAFGLRMCGHHEDAEDVFQETLLKAFEGLSGLREPGAVRTWLFQVASNQCRMKRRKVGPSRELSLDAFKPAGFEEGEMAEIPDWSHLPEDEARRGELRRGLAAALLELPPEYRLVVLLRDVEGLSTRETAEALALNEGTVKMRLSRARLALRDRLARFIGNDGFGGRQGEAG